MHDARAIANMIVDAALRYGYALSNLKLQKLLFFAHGRHLLELKRPLVKGDFEAWQFGPVHPAAYEAFKKHGAANIPEPALGFDPVKRSPIAIEIPSDPEVRRIVDRTVLEFGRMSPARLVKLTHVPGGPWATTVINAKTNANLGLRINSDTIIEKFHAQIMVLEDDELGDCPSENAPYS